MLLQGSILTGVMEDQYSFVELVSTLPSENTEIVNGNMDQYVISGARTSYLGHSKGKEADKKLLKYLMDNHHDSPFEQPQATFRIRAPKMCLIQILRHRAFHFNMESGRYTEVQDELYMPTHWRLQSMANKQMSGDIASRDVQAEADKRLENQYALQYDNYQWALDNNIAKELARGYLPSDFMYATLILTGDLRNLLHFFELRTESHAQWETRRIACAMYYLLEPRMPWTADLWVAKQSDDVVNNLADFIDEVKHD